MHSLLHSLSAIQYFINSKKMKRDALVFISLVLTSSIIFLLSSSKILAISCSTPIGFECLGGCTAIGDCVAVGGSGRLCTITGGNQVKPEGGSCELNAGSVVIGPIRPPVGVGLYNAQTNAPGTQQIGILLFVSNALKFFAVICGLLVFFNILYAGYEYIVGAGKTDVHVKVREKLTWSVIGLILLIAAYMIAALIGLFIFGDSTFLLNPDLTKYGALAP